MPRPPRPPTEVVRLPSDAVDVLRADAELNGGTLHDAARRLLVATPEPVPPPPDVAQRIPLGPTGTSRPPAGRTVLVDEVAAVCTCRTPDLTGYGVCRTCHLRRR